MTDTVSVQLSVSVIGRLANLAPHGVTASDMVEIIVEGHLNTRRAVLLAGEAYMKEAMSDTRPEYQGVIGGAVLIPTPPSTWTRFRNSWLSWLRGGDA